MNKQSVREAVWDDLEESGEARFPFPPHDRIPNFAGAGAAADRLADQPEWEEAEALKSNPDAPQLPARRRALRADKFLYVAVPRLADEDPFYELDPDAISDVDDATTISGMGTYGVQVAPEAMPRIDLVISGSVAVTADGDRVGKGEGYSDLEFAILRELGLVDEGTTVATTVHERQIVDENVGTAPHDVPMDLIVTPERVIRTEGGTKPAGIDWNLVDAERLAEIPVLERFEE
jgi:5-formyltetrahydrofolate cyclo-ligase